MTHDLTIALRVSPILSRQHLFFTSKRDMVEACFDSLVESLEGLSYYIVVILDNCPQFAEIFKKRVDEKHLKMTFTKGIGNANTFLYQIQILLDQTKTEYVYFAEDDYYYIGKMSDALKFISAGNHFVDFLTPYDHPDYYSNLHKYKKITTVYKGKVWKQIASTTMTFLTSKKNLQETERILRLYPLLSDYLMWNMLTRKTPLWKFLQPTYRWACGYRKLPFSWLYTIWNYTRYRRYSLWAPEPTIGTHLNLNGLSPRICWKTEIGKCLLTRSKQPNALDYKLETRSCS